MQAQACLFKLLTSNKLVVGAVGEVGSGGYTNPTLVPMVYIVPPADGIWEFSFQADEPAGVAIAVNLPIAAFLEIVPPDWMTGVRIRSAANQVEPELYSVLGEP